MKKSLRKPGTFWQLVFDTDATSVRDIKGYDFRPEEFDYLVFKRGIPFSGGLPSNVKLRLEANAKPISDFPGNALGWPVMSDRLVNHLWPLIKDSVQLIPALLFERNSDKPVLGYSIINVTKILDCVDLSCSVPWFSGDRLAGFNEVCIDPQRTYNANIFKYIIPPDKVDFSVICSFELVKSLEGKGFTGLAFLRCRCPDDWSGNSVGGDRTQR